MRTQLAQDGGQIDLKTLQETIQKTESELKAKSDSILNSLNSQVAILPSLEEQELQDTTYELPMENLWNISTKKKSIRSGSATEGNQANKENLLSLRSAAVQNQDLVMSNNEVEAKINEEISPIMRYAAFGPTPGQQVFLMHLKCNYSTF